MEEYILAHLIISTFFLNLIYWNFKSDQIQLVKIESNWIKQDQIIN